MLKLLRMPPEIWANWRHKTIPMAIRSDEKRTKVLVHLPFGEDNRVWLHGLGKTRPKYVRDHQAWEIPKAWFNKFVEAALLRYRRVYVVQPYREYEVCAPACRNAKGHDCNCSCRGKTTAPVTVADGLTFQIRFLSSGEKRKWLCG
ncbi:hypothetical protein OA238_c18120 [Octadecabacter arcticus 238]|uniref:Uncharacterized protein n=1 Tax=Octadecabacter arcticus 238 TaxID=391616 RepID=M9RNE0_9RHOB|nr:hypothetical protein OA238_c18120 [Octadecabacter arcticus 238]